MERKQEDNQQRMMIFDELLQFIGVNQNEISNGIFERTNSFEKKEGYQDEDHRISLFFRVEIQPKHSYSKKKNISNVLVSKEENKVIPVQKIVHREEKREIERDRNEYKPLDSSLETFFGNDISNYQWIDLKYRNRNFVYTYFHSFFNIFDDMFIQKSEMEKTTIIKDCLKKMLEELYMEGNYQKYYYHRNRKFKKEWIQTTLNHALLLNQKVKYDHFYIIQQYISDYFGVNTFVINILEDGNIHFDSNESYLTKQYGGIINPYISHIFILKKRDIYYPVIGNTNIENYLLYRTHKTILDRVYSYYHLDKMYEIMFDTKQEEKEEEKKEEEIQPQPQLQSIEEDHLQGVGRERNENSISYHTLSVRELKNKKIAELHMMCDQLHISIYKKSEKTGKDIKKTKDELLQDISKVIYDIQNHSSCESSSS